MNRSLFWVAALWLAIIMPAAAQDVVVCEKESGDVAIAACDRAIASGKLNKGQLAWSYHNRAVEYEIKKLHDVAMADYNRALQVDPDRPSSLVGRGNAYNNKGDYERALKDYNNAIRLDGKSPNAYQNRGLAYFRMKDYTHARADYEMSLKLPPRNNADRDAQTKAREQLDDTLVALRK